MNLKSEQKQQIISILLMLIIFLTAIFIGLFIQHHKKSSNSLVSTSYRKNEPKFIYAIEEGKPWGKLKEPMQALAYAGRLYIADTGNSRVLVFDLKGNYLFELEEDGDKNKRRLKYPYGLASDGKGNLYVADPVVGNVLIFNYLGKFIGYLNQDKRYYAKPAGITIYQGRIYISDIGLHKVFVFDKKYNFLFSIGSGSNGSLDYDFYYPNAVNVSNIGKIYVSDSMNNRVQVFSRDGKFQETIGGDKGMSLINPRGLAIDTGGNLFVASTLDSDIEVVDKDGVFLFSIAKGDNYSLSLPIDVSIDTFNNLYITDKGTNKVLIFKR